MLQLAKYGLLLCICFSNTSWAQYYNLPNNSSFNYSVEQKLARLDDSAHSAIQPYIPFFGRRYEFVPDSAITRIKHKWLSDVLFQRSFIDLKTDSGLFRLKINPIVNIEAGRDLAGNSSNNLYTNTRGIIGAGQIGQRFYFETMFAENQSVFPSYLETQVKQQLVVPGQGRWKNFKVNGFDYAFSSGFISMQINPHLNIQLGHGKQKIGYGYRSLLLSDNALAYPYARITQQWLKGRLQYTNIYAMFMNLVSASKTINPNAERLYQKKAASFHYLSFNPNKRINIGLFQSLIWQPGDSSNKQHLSWEYFNPVMFGSIPSLGLDNRNDINIGADLRLKLNSSLSLYFQALLDHRQRNNQKTAGYAFQTGLNYFAAFGIKGLHLQSEYTATHGDCYQSKDLTSQYTHYNQTIGYVPLEGSEFMGQASYRHKRWFMQTRIQQQQHIPDQVNKNTITLLSGFAGIIVNPAYNLQLSLGALVRKQKFATFSTGDNQTQYLFVTLRTSIYNFYYDY